MSMSRAKMGKQIARPPMKKKIAAKMPPPPAMAPEEDMGMVDPRMRAMRPGGMKTGGMVKKGMK
jgi:hypothetical protein